MIEFEGRAFCTFETSWIVPNSYTNVVDNRLSIYGEKGGLELKNEPTLWAFTDRFHTPFSSESVTRYGKAWGFQYESIRYFVDCVADDVMPEASGRDGAHGDGDDRGDVEVAGREAAGHDRRSARSRSRSRQSCERRSMSVLDQFVSMASARVVTGASRGLGRVDGARAGRCRRRRRHHRPNAGDARRDGRRDSRAWPAGVDGRQPTWACRPSARRRAQRILRDMGPIDILINNVGNREVSVAIESRAARDVAAHRSI